MDHGIASISIIPVMQKPAHDSEMVSQLLFGETYSVTEYEKDWLKIQMHFDNYTGFISINQHLSITNQWLNLIQTTQRWYAAELMQTVTNHDITFPILIGSELHEFDGINFKMGKDRLVYTGNTLPDNGEYRQQDFINKISKKFLNAPYLWGGRSPFGVDCSGLVQVVFKICGIQLPRDAYQQAESGSAVNFILEAQPGDLCFFDNGNDKIVHVGILLKDQKIIHASGKVRIDPIDHYGIYNPTIKKYSHKLRIIKRVL